MRVLRTLAPVVFAVLGLSSAMAASLATPDLTCRVRATRHNVVRSAARRRLFLRMTGFPKGRPGYAVDHLVPLACGGCDVPANMTWLTLDEWRAKTPWERKPCSAWWDGTRTRQIQKAITEQAP